MKRDGASVSIWQNVEGYIPVNTFDVNKEYDVIIVGAGITGITTALQLQASHLSCLLVEANTIGFGTSSGTTAHLNTFFDITYQQVIKNFGEKKAKLLVKAAKSAMSLIKQNIALYKIDCGYENKEGYLFSLNEKQFSARSFPALKSPGIAPAFSVQTFYYSIVLLFCIP